MFGLLAVLCVPPGIHIADAIERKSAKERLSAYRRAALDHFRAQCKHRAGERIYRTVSDVDGFLLERPRSRPTTSELADRHWKGDPYGNDYYGDAEIASYLQSLNSYGIPNDASVSGPAFHYVEVAPTPGGRNLRFVRDPRGAITRAEVSELRSTYSVAWEDVSTDEDRKYWIAGSRIYVVRRDTREVLGERVGYILERGFGSTSGGRRPWLHARISDSRLVCPPFKRNAAINRLFVEKVLVPR